jgi:hypothetical protein
MEGETARFGSVFSYPGFYKDTVWRGMKWLGIHRYGDVIPISVRNPIHGFGVPLPQTVR